jgi:hypothetical protein
MHGLSNIKFSMYFNSYSFRDSNCAPPEALPPVNSFGDCTAQLQIVGHWQTGRDVRVRLSCNTSDAQFFGKGGNFRPGRPLLFWHSTLVWNATQTLHCSGLVNGLLTTSYKWQKLFRIEWSIEESGKAWGETLRNFFPQCVNGPNTQKINLTLQ